MIIFLTFAAEMVSSVASFAKKGKKSQHLDVSTIKSIIYKKNRANLFLMNLHPQELPVAFLKGTKAKS